MPTSLPTAIGDLARRRAAPVLLELDLTDGVLEHAPSDPVGRALTMRRPVLRHVLDGLRLARADRKVAGLVVKLGGRRFALATAQELREAVAAFRAAGKWAIAWSESFAEFAPGQAGYYLATACDEVWLMPTGCLGLVGVGVDVTFLRGALERADTEMQLGQRHEYKTAANRFTETSFTPAHRESAERLAVSAYDRMVADIAAARGLAETAVRAAADRGPLLATEALAERLVDRLGYRDEVYAEARRRAGGEPRLQFLERYRRHAERPRPARVVRAARNRHEPVVALVHAVGGIKLGRSGRSPLTGPTMGSDTVSAALRAAAADDAVRAIVLRVDSPGGSAAASDVVWREVLVAQDAGKPVVVSMGDVAGSGGYYIAAGARVIVAQPATLTGSIGVVGGKLVNRGLLERFGLTTDTVTVGGNATIASSRHRYSDAEWERLNAYLDQVYEDFTGKVAEGRRMSRADVHDIAKGRVWTGADAREIGLVDHLGGLDLAVALARDLASLPAERGRVREYPKVSPIARVRPASSSEDPAAAGARAALLPATGLVPAAGALAGGNGWGALAPLAAALGLPAAGALTMPFGPLLG